MRLWLIEPRAEQYLIHKLLTDCSEFNIVGGRLFFTKVSHNRKLTVIYICKNLYNKSQR